MIFKKYYDNRSLSSILMVFFFLTSVFIIGGAIAVLYWSLLDHLRKDDESYLVDKIEVLRRVVGSSDKLLINSAVISDPIVRINTKVFVKIISYDNKIIISTPGFDKIFSINQFPYPNQDSKAMATIRRNQVVGTDGQYYRTASAVCLNTNNKDKYIIFVAFDNRQADYLIVDYKKWLFLVFLGSIVISILFGHQIVTRGLKPLDRLTLATKSINTSRLDYRIESAGLPRELFSLSESFNAMMNRLENAFDRISRFSSDIAHELRNPLNNIMGMAEVSLQRNRTNAEYQEVIASCLEEFNRLSQLIETLLFLARAEHPQMAISNDRIDVKSEIQHLVGFYRPSAEELKINFNLNISNDDLKIYGDRILIQRAFGNIIENSLYYIRGQGTITIDIIRKENDILITIIDNGCGVAEDHVPHVFDRLYRSDKSRSSDGRSGLGLAMVKTIVELHDGEISLRSTLGVGTEVCIRLPITKMSKISHIENTDGKNRYTGQLLI